MSSTGKIARLSAEIRDELNRRLHNGERGRSLLEWLNGLPQTQQILASAFGGRPINHVNLTAWRAGGYQAWLARHETFLQTCQQPTEAVKWTDPSQKITGHLTGMVAARYAAALMDWDGQITLGFRQKLRALERLSQSAVRLRRGDLTAARINLDHECLELKNEETLM